MGGMALPGYVLLAGDRRSPAQVRASFFSKDVSFILSVQIHDHGNRDPDGCQRGNQNNQGLVFGTHQLDDNGSKDIPEDQEKQSDECEE
jgi:hypothetical protein